MVWENNSGPAGVYGGRARGRGDWCIYRPLFDKGLKQLGHGLSPEQRKNLEQLFFTTVFTLSGRLAKSDGRVSEEEIKHAEALMQQMGLSSDHRQDAIRLFKVGAEAGYNPGPLLQSFKEGTTMALQLRQLLIVYLIGMAMADGAIDPAERSLLERCAAALGMSDSILDQLISMAQAQTRFHGGESGSHRQYQPRGSLEDAYKALGVSAEASDGEVKKAYRKLISEYHPDKLMGQGVPEDMIKLATERSQEVQTAYDLIKKSRKTAS